MALKSLLTMLFAGLSLCAHAAEPDERDAVAMVHYVQGDVKVRRSQELVWNGAQERIRLYNRDAIKTGPGASVAIWFNDYTKVNVNENSMVIVLDTGVKPGVRESAVVLPSGSVGGNVGRNVDRPLELVVRTSRGWIKANSDTQDPQGSNFKASVSTEGSLQVKSNSGRVKVATKGKEAELKPREQLTVAPGSALSATSGETTPEKAFDQLPDVADTEWLRTEPKQEPAPRKTAAAPVKVALPKSALPAKSADASPPQGKPTKAKSVTKTPEPEPTPEEKGVLSAPQILTAPKR